MDEKALIYQRHGCNVSTAEFTGTRVADSGHTLFVHSRKNATVLSGRTANFVEKHTKFFLKEDEAAEKSSMRHKLRKIDGFWHCTVCQ
jgi:hypothetical protein